MDLKSKIIKKMTPVYNIPDHLLGDYTMGYRIPISKWFFNDVPNRIKFFHKTTIDQLIEMIKEKKVAYAYPSTDISLYKSLDINIIKNKTIAIMGSTFPWYESICLSYEGFPVTIEYNKILTNDDRLRIMTVKEYNENPEQFDMAFSISSFEHDGLGRYGDPIDPNGDLKAMKKMKTMIKKDGIMFLSVPCGDDELAWNAHRIYGKIRLPLLLDGWEVLDTYKSEDRYKNKNGQAAGCENLFILKNI